jgi:predicted phosphodiesterase
VPGAAGFGVVVAGHSHKPLIEEKRGVLYVNHGRAGPRRFNLPVSVGLLRIRSIKPTAEIVRLPI